MLVVAIKNRKRAEKIEYFHAYREAFLCSIFTNLYRNPDKIPEPVSLYDFLPEYPRPEEKPPERTIMTDEEIESTVINFVYPMLKAGER